MNRLFSSNAFIGSLAFVVTLLFFYPTSRRQEKNAFSPEDTSTKHKNWKEKKERKEEKRERQENRD